MVVFQVPKNDRWIKKMAKKGMIEPFNESLKTEGVISSGVGSYGYDMRISNEFKIFTPRARDPKKGVVDPKKGVVDPKKGVVDPKEIDPDNFTDFKGDICTIPPNSYVLGRSVEYFRIPRDVLVICFGKSTYARCGILVNVTPLEPEWEGYLTIAVSNTTPLPAKLYANEGIAQLVFLGAGELCGVSYADRSGKYQVQSGITLSRT